MVQQASHPQHADPEGQAGIQGNILQDLLGKPPLEVANWAVDQLSSLMKADVNLKTTPVFQLATALKSATKEQKQAVVRKAMAGVGDLPAQRRTEAVRLVMQNLSEAKQTSDQGSKNIPLVRNLWVLAHEARLDKMPREELNGIVQEAQTEAARAVKPDELLTLVQELPQQQREGLTEVLVEAHVVPEEHRSTLEEAVRPGGHVDKLASALRALDAACAFRWVVIFALPAGELTAAWVLGFRPCGAPLVGWLRFDSLLTLAASTAFACVTHTLHPVYCSLREDPMGARQQWQAMQKKSHGWKTRLEAAVPGVGLDTYQAAGKGTVACLGIELLGAVWAVLGVLQLLAAAELGCSGAVALACAAFAVLRLGTVTTIAFLLCSSGDVAAEAEAPGPAEVLVEAPPRPETQSRWAAWRSSAPNEAFRLPTWTAPASRTAKLPKKGPELHQHIANDHASLLEHLENLEGRVRAVVRRH